MGCIGSALPVIVVEVMPHCATRDVAPCLLAALCIACSSGAPPNLLLVVVDTLRADHLGSYGHVRDTSPRIDALASDGVRFERAYSSAPWTMPSVASILTGRLPSSHGVMRSARALPGRAVTLAERLQQAGYRTGAVTSHIVLGPRFGFGQGFDVFHSKSGGHRSITGTNVTLKVVSLIEDFAGADDRPFFVFVHYFDPHYAYQGHSDYDFAGERLGRIRSGMRYQKLLNIRHKLGEAELEFVRALYDEEIRFTDEQIGLLLDALARVGADDETLVVLTGDHGEEFMEHGWIGHTTSLHDTLVRVPLVVGPARFTDGARVVGEPVSLVGLAPTLLELLGLAAASPAFDADSFAPLARGSGGGPEAVFAEVDYHQHRDMRTSQRMVVAYPYKLIEDRLSGRLSLYDLSEDPVEQHDLADGHPDIVTKLRTGLERLGAGTEATPAAALSEEERNRLRDLGYVE
jgi:arylsulfatase A-like enzyme